MTVKALTPVRIVNLVVPLPHEGTDTRITDTPAREQQRSGAVAPLKIRPSDVESTHRRSTRTPTPGTRTSTTATRTTTTRRPKAGPEPSADSHPFTFENLVTAYLDCRRSKRNSASALAFEAHLERNLVELHRELIAGAYTPGRSICFVVTRPKPREVWAADFRDRVVHHLLYNHIAPRFHARFSVESCACIPGRGTLYAARRLEHHARSVTAGWQRPAHYLKCDLANFFVAIDKHVLRAQLAAQVHEPWWLRLAELILFHDPRVDVELRGSPAKLALVPPHKSLFNAPADTGLPIGNLSSQFFANVHLDALDQFAKHRLHATHYVRYVDDFILLHESAAWLAESLRDIATFLPERLHAHLNQRKTIQQTVARGIDFVGHIVRPWHSVTRPKTVATAIRRIELLPADELHSVGNSYLGLVRQATHGRSEQIAIARALLKRGKVVDGNLSRCFRGANKGVTA